MQHKSHSKSIYSCISYRALLISLCVVSLCSFRFGIYSRRPGWLCSYIITKGGKTHKLRPIRMAGRISKAIAQKFWAPDFLRSTFVFSLYARLITAQRPNTVWCRLCWPNNIFPGSSPLSLFPALEESYEFEGGHRVEVVCRGGPMTLRGEKKLGLIYKYRSKYRTTGFFFLLLPILSKKRNVFLTIDIWQ